MLPPPRDKDVVDLARELASLGRDRRSGVYHMSWWSDRVIRWAMSHEAFKTQLFRLVDTFPSLHDDPDVVSDYLEQYFEGVDIPKIVDLGLALTDSLPGGHRLSALVTHRNIEKMARQFIVGADENQAAAGVTRLWNDGIAATVDLLGEHTLSQEEADSYARRVDRMLESLIEASSTWRHTAAGGEAESFPPISMSLKVSALTSSFSPLHIDRAVAEARKRFDTILSRVADGSATLYLDVESYETKEIIHRLLEQIAADPGSQNARLGIVVQSYLTDAFDDLKKITAISQSREVPLTVRLVKGAYWDSETIISAAQGWPNVVFEHKEQTDANFERCARYMLGHIGEINCAFASHNLRSISYVISTARQANIPDTGYEMQLLYGMGELVTAALKSLGSRVRVYCPVGELVEGMSYLVRRLLENTSNESFVRHRYGEGRKIGDLVAAPDPGELPTRPPVACRTASDHRQPGEYRPEPLMEWRRSDVRAAMADSVEELAKRPARHITALIDGQSIDTGVSIASVDPGDPTRTLAEVTRCGRTEVEDAVEAARRAARSWSRSTPEHRAGVLFRAASWMRARRRELACLQVFEVGKAWAEADADVCEAIDFCEYYGREAIRLGRGGKVQSAPGETNLLVYEPRGVVAVIPPWNFPLAIPTGMTAGALAAGNSVVLKPAEQSPASAFALVEALLAAGLPPEVIGFVPGLGEEAGDALVRNPDVDVISFTGSRAVGLSINEIAARGSVRRRGVTRVIAEMGGKNAIIVDGDADLDEAIPAIVRSAFGYAGQKCSAASRVIALDAIYERLVERLVGAVAALSIGHPRDMDTDMGPLIEESAVARVSRYRNQAGAELLYARDDVPICGYFAGPAIFGNVDPASPLATEEIFGPLLALMRAPDLDRAVEIANATDYGLTAGIISRSPRNIRRATTMLQAGNVYVNRPITGSVVGRQPFGGRKLSGMGAQAGGPDYLGQLVNAKVISENTMRHGFAPRGETEP